MIDPIVVGAVSNRLWSILEEQQTALVSTAFSPVVRESLDLACAIFDSHGDMIGQSIGGTPGHINAMATGMHHFVAAFPPETLVPGDVLITNNPWQTAGQINDLTVTTPVFKDGRLIAWFASCCHSPDIGGRLLSAEAREVYEEGLHLPIMKLVSAGVLDPTIETIVRANVRTPDETMGDILAQIAGNEVASRSLLRMLDELGLDSIDPVAAEIMARSERALRAALAELPDGEHEAVTQADGFGDPVTLAVRVTIDGDAAYIDFTGSSPQSRHGFNVVLNYTHAYASFAIKSAITPGVPHNAGSFRPVHVTAPEGSILNCVPPAPVAARHLIGHMLPSLIFDALRPVMPERLMAYSADSLWLTVWAGPRRDGRQFVFNTFQAGGTGARATKDGISTIGFPTGVRGTPTEVMEVDAPLIQVHRELRTDSGGPGRWRGGLGQRTRVRSDSGNDWTVNANVERIHHPARGVEGGGDGAPGVFRLAGGDHLQSKQLHVIPTREAVDLDLPGGGGYGDPKLRPEDAVLWDVIEGYVSVEEARRSYGVEVVYTGSPEALVRLPEMYHIDRPATDALRS